MTNPIVVLVSCPPEIAEPIAQALVEERLAACVSIIGPVKSVYRWQGVQVDQEYLLMIKTEKNRWQDLEAKVKELHTYDVPEIICLPVELGHKAYLDWLKESTITESALTGGRAESDEANFR